MTSQNDESWLLLTNDDGIEAIGLELLVKTLNSRGHKVIVFAPQENHSAAGMKINLMKEIKWRFRNDLVERWQLENPNIIHLLELEGSPCDTMIVSLDGGLKHILPECSPCLVVSGVNLGPNMSGIVITAEQWVLLGKRDYIACQQSLHLLPHLRMMGCKLLLMLLLN